MDYNKLLSDLLKRNFETTWFEFKENWFEADKLGKYISALSNAALISHSDYAYFIWGINDSSHEVVGTKFDYNIEVNHEPLEHMLLRNIYPCINFRFDAFDYEGKRIVILIIPAAFNIPTSYCDVRYTRVGSSIESLIRYPEKEAEIWNALNHKEDSLETIASQYQDLTFNSLINYYSSKGINLNQEKFKDNLGFFTNDGRYNLLAQLLSDNSYINVRVAIFAGKTKADPLFSVKEFGMMNLLLSLDKVLDYGDTFNIPQADERHRVVTRKEISLFDANSYREAVINAFIHNDWRRNNAPMFTFYSDRIEILSHGPLSPKLTISDFYKGKSEPINKKLSDIFVQLHISERTGRGVPTILKSYGESAFDFSDNWIQVTIPFNFINVVDYQITPKVVNKSGEYVVNKNLNKNQLLILKVLRNNPNITIKGLCRETKLGHTAIQNNLNKLQDFKIIQRIGSRKKGYWEFLID
jgi:ATP-dependent DNA helicase RecG